MDLGHNCPFQLQGPVIYMFPPATIPALGCDGSPTPLKNMGKMVSDPLGEAWAIAHVHKREGNHFQELPSMGSSPYLHPT